MPINLLPKGAWFGNDSGLREVIEASTSMDDSIKTKGVMPLAYHGEEDEEKELPRLLSIVDSTAVININGSLVNNASYWNRHFGLTGYPEIKEAVIEAANDQSVKEIILNIDSGGGTVSGVFELAKFIKKIDSSIKPIKSINSGSMASAAYLIGSQASKVYTTEMAQTGSIGVIMIHQEYSKMFKEKGIEVTVVRAGKYKALVNPYEKLTEDAKTELQNEADFIHGKFIEVVANGREMSFMTVKENMADGKMFYSEEAIKLGLVDNITSIDKLVAELNEKYSDNSENFYVHVGDSATPSLNSSSIGEIDMATKKATLSKENQAKLANGIPLEKIDTSADDESTLDVEASDTKGVETEAKVDDSIKATAEDVKKDSTETKISDETKADSDLVSHLKAKETELSTKVAELSLQLSTAKADLATTQASKEGLEKIVVSACSRLSIGLGQTGADFSHLNGNALVEQHAKLDNTFCEKFKVGGVVESSSDPKAENKPRRANTAHLNAAKI